MCQFVSWVERRGKVYFLTGEQLFETEKGKEFCQTISPDDLSGHGTIRAYYGIDVLDGQDHECTDFRSPSKFPVPIIEALKAGKFKGFPLPVKLLSKALNDKYWADRRALADKYEADCKALYDKYWADLKPLYDKYEADCKALNDKYWADRRALYEKYWAGFRALNDKYEADRRALNEKYWELFAIPENRMEAWR